MARIFDPPSDEHEFQDICVRLYRRLWKNDGLKPYAKRGERQHGVDIYDPYSRKPVSAVQCKNRERTKTIPPKEIKEEVAKAEGSGLEIQRFVIATTARKAGRAQDTVAALNRRPDKQFDVDIHFWEDMCAEAEQFGFVDAFLIFHGPGPLKELLDAAGGTMQTVAVGSVEGDASPSGIDAFDEIDALFRERRIDAAAYELEKLPDGDDLQTLPPKERYMLLRLRAKLALESHDYVTASSLFLAAFDIASDSDQAKLNQVLAYILIDEEGRALELAKKYIADGVDTSAMAIRVVNCVSTIEELEEQADFIQRHESSDADLNVSLCHRYMQLGHFTEAMQAAERAVSLAADSPHAHFALGAAKHNAAIQLKPPERVQQLQEAIEQYTAAEKLAREQHFEPLLAEVLMNRGNAYTALGDMEAAAAAFHSLISAAGKATSYANHAVKFFLHSQDFSTAWACLDAIDLTSPEGRHLALITEYHNGDDEAKERAFDGMRQLADEQIYDERACRSFCVQWALDRHDFDAARECVPDSFVAAHPFQGHTLSAWIAASQQNDQKGREEAGKALDASVEDVHRQDVCLLAQVLSRLGDDKRALELLLNAVLPGILDLDMRLLIACAQRLDRHDVLLRLCRELREAGAHDEQLFKMEVDLLNQYVPDEALAVAELLISRSNTPEFYVAYRNSLLVRLQRPDKCVFDAARLPKPGQVSAERSSLVMLPYIATGRYDEALRFMYGQLRHFFDTEVAHGGYTFFIVQYGQHCSGLDSPDVVTNDCAVRLQSRTGEGRWYIIEDDGPSASRYEFLSTGELSSTLIGKTVGDEVEVPAAFFKGECATIEAIQSKYIRAYQDSMEHFNRRFPESSAFQKFSVGDENNPDFSILQESVQRRREHAEEILAFNRKNPCSAYWLAEQLGVNEVEVIRTLANQREHRVFCVPVSPGEFEKLASETQSGNTFVLDLSALITITNADAWDQLPNDKTYLVSQQTAERIDIWVHEFEETTRHDNGFIAAGEDGRLIWNEPTDEERASRKDVYTKLQEAVAAHCVRRSSLRLSEASTERRKVYEEIVGLHNAEAMAVAADTGAILWTDDVVNGVIGTADFGVSRGWTQLIMRQFVNEEMVSQECYDLLSAKLAAWRYEVIFWNAQTLLAAAKEAEWDANVWPFNQCISYLDSPDNQLPAHASIVYRFLKHVYYSECNVFRSTPIIQATLTALHSAPAVRWMLRRFDNEIEVGFAHVIRVELELWLEQHPF
ncbi:MAG: hypothetical protein HQ518_00080 [Rhodopirellula sp.]|nr:hypothetical protein [Rhodopirellula sp.]